MSEEAPQQDRPVVLIADDDVTMRLLIRETLEQAGFTVAETEDGVQALSAFVWVRPDIVLWTILGHRVRYLLRASRAVEALRKSEAKNRALLQAVPDLIAQLGRDGTFLDYKSAKDSDPLLPPEQFLGRKVPEVHPPEVARQLMASVEQVLQTRETQVCEYQLLQDGALRD